jgi:hypothetical protein
MVHKIPQMYRFVTGGILSWFDDSQRPKVAMEPRPSKAARKTRSPGLFGA